MSSPSVPALEDGPGDAIEEDKKAHAGGNGNDQNHGEEPIATSQGNKNGFEMVPLEDTVEQ